MNLRSKPLEICALLLCPLLLRAAPPEDPARLPYEWIYRMQKTEATLALTYTNLTMYLRMTPTLPGVKIEDVTVYIPSKEGRIPVALNPTNGIFTVPIRESLLAEKAWIVTSQPKGTMNFQWFVGMESDQLPVDGIHYRALMEPLKAVVLIRDEMAKVPGMPALTIAGLKMLYLKQKEAAVVIHAKSGDRVFKTDQTHSLVIPYEQALLAEDPTVSIPVPPERVFVADPDSDK
jgi:hypothetical protein